MSYTLPKLAYECSSLEPYIDTETMQIHHSKHHNTYITNLNNALKTSSNITKDLAALQAQAPTLGAAIRNNGGGHYNHSLFWQWMAPVGTSNSAPFGELKDKIEQKFGSVDNFKTKFTEAAVTRFGSGWAWLGVDSNGEVDVTSTTNQDNPLMPNAAHKQLIPILGLDVWEHAYYLKYQNRRPEYVSQWWNVVNWDNVVKFYDSYAKHQKPVPAGNEI